MAKRKRTYTRLKGEKRTGDDQLAYVAREMEVLTRIVERRGGLPSGVFAREVAYVMLLQAAGWRAVDIGQLALIMQAAEEELGETNQSDFEGE